MTCYKFRPPAHLIVHGLQLAFGVALSLLGLLDIGSQTIVILQDTELKLELHRPMYRVVVNNLGLMVVFIAYTLVVLGSSVSRVVVVVGSGSGSG